jgi:hypothetical protein
MIVSAFMEQAAGSRPFSLAVRSAASSSPILSRHPGMCCKCLVTGLGRDMD